ncbi:MAG TPA: VOC family protein [Longimicrobiales bacterium]
MDTADTFGLGRIGQIALVVDDLARAAAFYRDVLGLRFLFDVPGQMAFFDCDGVWLMLGLPEGGGGREPGRAQREHPGSVLYFDVGDIGEAHGVLEGRGVEFLAAPHRVADLGTHELWMAFFRDPDGHTLALRSRVEK